MPDDPPAETRDSSTPLPLQPSSTPAKGLVTLTVIVDIICPWCYVSFARIIRAIKLARENGLPLAFDLKFEPYTLDPHLPASHGVPKMDRLIDRLGEHKALAEVRGLYKAGKELGIEFSYYGVTSQSMLAHRLLMKAHLEGGSKFQLPLLKEIFRGYFEDDRDVADVSWLASCAARVSLMSPVEATTFLQSSELQKEVVEAQKEMAGRAGISGVPFLIINRKWVLSGAQSQQVYHKIFEKIADRLKPRLASAEEVSKGD